MSPMVLYVAGVAVTLWNLVHHTDCVPSMSQEHKVIVYTKGEWQWTILRVHTSYDRIIFLLCRVGRDAPVVESVTKGEEMELHKKETANAPVNTPDHYSKILRHTAARLFLSF